MKLPRLVFAPVWLAAPALAALWYTATRVEYQTDLWHCLTSGRLMWETGGLIQRDAFTHTIAGQPILNQPWLAQCLMYGLVRLGGVELVTYAAAILYALAVGIVTALAWRRSGDMRVAAALGLVAVALAASNFSVRTQMFSAPLFAVELYALWHWPGRWRTVAVVGVVETLWTNCHGAFPLGVVLPAAFLAAALVEGRLAGAVRGNRALGVYAAATAIALGAMFVNPHPAATLDYVGGVASASALRGLDEWRATSAASWTGAMFAASAAAMVVVIGLGATRSHPARSSPLAGHAGTAHGRSASSAAPRMVDLLLLVAFALLAQRAERMVIWWALVLPPAVAPRAVELWARWRRPRADEPDAATLPVALALAAITVFFTPWTRAANPLLPPSKRAAWAADEPHAAVEFLQRSPWTGRALNTMEWGAYLSWRLDPRVKVFIDPRVDFFPDRVWDEYLSTATAAPGWEAILDRRGIDLVVWNRRLSEALPQALERAPGWERVYQDDLAAVYRRGAASRPIGM